MTHNTMITATILAAAGADPASIEQYMAAHAAGAAACQATPETVRAALAICSDPDALGAALLAPCPADAAELTGLRDELAHGHLMYWRAITDAIEARERAIAAAFSAERASRDRAADIYATAATTMLLTALETQAQLWRGRGAPSRDDACAPAAPETEGRS